MYYWKAALTIIATVTVVEKNMVHGPFFTQFTTLDEKPPDGYTLSGERLSKIPATTRPDYLWPDVWSNMSNLTYQKEKHNWAIEKPKLDKARKLRGICYTDPDDTEFQNTMKNARRKLEVPLEPAVPRKISNQQRQI